MKRSQFVLFALFAMVFTGCAGMTAAEATTVAVTGTGALVGFVQALAPMLSPEQQAALTATATQVQSTVEATTTAVGQIARALADLRAQQQALEAGELTGGEVAAVGTGLTGLAVAASRIMSRFKHGPVKPA